MRLLDLIAQSREPLLVLSDAEATRPLELSAPCHFAHRIVQCPLRYVLADDLTRASGELAFAQGDRLADCLDLLRIPAPLLWVEWSDTVHQQIVSQCGTVPQRDPTASGRKAGVLIQATPCGRSASARTFWSSCNAVGKWQAQLSPVETYLNLEHRFAPAITLNGMFGGEFASVTDSRDSGVAALLECTRFRFEETWLKYYSEAARDAETRESVARQSLAAVACDIPLLLGFFLLLNAKGATEPFPVRRVLVNRKRLARDQAPLLDHIEVRSRLESAAACPSGDVSGLGIRRPARLHHVRGHLVRRDDRIFWRTAHLRGNAQEGVVRSRTVCLSGFP